MQHQNRETTPHSGSSFSNQDQENNWKQSSFRAEPPAGGESHFSIEVPAVTLPRGGGAIKAIEEKFQAGTASGTATLSIPLPFSHSRRDFHPALALEYDSGNGNGPFGMGWSLTVPAISRKTEKKLPRYRDAADPDTFILAGAEDLVPFLSSAGWTPETALRHEDGRAFEITRYRPRVERAFGRIEKWLDRSSGIVHWRTISRNNVKSFYGLTASSRIADPGDERRIFQWFLSHSCDDKGNLIVYEYKAEDFAGIPATVFEHNKTGRCANTYLKRILYGNRSPYVAGQPLPDAGDFLFQTVFDYGEHPASVPVPVDIHDAAAAPWASRPDVFSSCRAGFEIRTYRRCRRMLQFHCFDEGDLPVNPCLVRSLELQYRDHFESGEGGEPVAGFSFLEKIRQTGYRLEAAGGHYLGTDLPVMEFGYQPHLWRQDVKRITRDLPAGFDGRRHQWVDLYSEGIAGILTEQDGGLYFQANAGEGRFAAPQPVVPAPSLQGLASGRLQVQDLEGDGRKYLVSYDAVPQGFYARDHHRQWRPFRSFERLPNQPLADPDARLVDLTGDGRPDLLVAEENLFWWYPGDGEKGFGPGEAAAKAIDEERGPAVIFADGSQSIFLADMNGDGLLDIVRIRNGEVCYWANMGYGRFSAKVTMADAPVFDDPGAFHPAYLRLADTDGSGPADLIYLGHDTFQVWLNLNGNRWTSGPMLVNPFPKVDNLANIQVLDLLGNGTACIVWSSPLPGNREAPMQYVDLMGSRKPHLLVSYRNNLGKEVELRYRPSTYYYLEDKKAGQPWATHLPFPVQVLAETVITDQVSQSRLVRQYTYHHGFYDHAEREFRGFGRVDQYDAETFDHFRRDSGGDIVEAPFRQAPVLVRTWYDTGAYFEEEPLRNHYAHEYYRDPAGMMPPRPPALELPAGLTADARIIREARRACRSMMLRREVYGLDESPAAAHPYSVEEQSCYVRLLQPHRGHPYASFLVSNRESITCFYERQPEQVRVSHRLNLLIDEAGLVVESAEVDYPRLTIDPALPAALRAEQERHFITYTVNQFTNDVDSGTAYRLRQVASTRTYELTGITPDLRFFRVEELRSKISGATPIPFEAVPAPGPHRRLTGEMRTLYLSDDLAAPLPLGRQDTLGLACESYRLAFTDTLISERYGGRVDATHLTEGRYRSAASLKAGSLFPASDPDDEWWMPSGRLRYPADPLQHFYLPDQYVDPYGYSTWATYDPRYHLYVAATEDELGNTMSVDVFDFRVLAPLRIRDANDNLSEVRYDRLGVVVGTALLGKGDEADDFTGFREDLSPAEIAAFFDDPVAHGADLLQHASTRFVYDYQRRPAAAASISRTIHHRDAQRQGSSSPLQFAFEYTNGAGGVLMRKVQAEPGEAFAIDESGHRIVVDTGSARRWAGTGRTIHNNKGLPVKQYEPYFSATHHYETEGALVEIGFTPLFHYDAPGRRVRTLFPDGTFQYVTIAPWRRQTFDANDTVAASDWYAERTTGSLAAVPAENQAAVQTVVHDNTPFAEHHDARGRPVYAVDHNRYRDPASGTIEEDRYGVFTRLDIAGNVLELIDARGNTVVASTYDILGSLCRQVAMDSGERWTFSDCLGKVLHRWDAKGRRFTSYYDELHRPAGQRVSLPGGTSLLLERMLYGEEQPDNRERNLRNRLFRQYDGAGSCTYDRYDFKGNTGEEQRRFCEDFRLRPDWSAPETVPLASRIFTTSCVFDALNRPVLTNLPDGSSNHPRYNESGLLEALAVNVRGSGISDFVTNIDYDAKGQRTAITYGNGIVTSYAYDPKNYRLKRVFTIHNGSGNALQDLRYTYDPVGNITNLKDQARQALFFNNQIVDPDCDYEYDSLYRLIRATGREHIGQNRPVEAFDLHRMRFANPANGSAMQRYRQYFYYDGAGNMQRMVHNAGLGSFTHRWTRHFAVAPANNRLLSVTVGAETATYSYGAHGQIAQMEHLDALHWDFNDQLGRVELPDGSVAYYCYDAHGRRRRKVIERGGTVRERFYAGPCEFYEEREAGAIVLARDTLHIRATGGDDSRRIAVVDTRTQGDDGTAAQVIRYQLTDHLNSSLLEVDPGGRIISYETYYPYGSTSFQSGSALAEVSLKRYRFGGRERDEESGLYYGGARYYAPWLARWTAPDPGGLADGPNRYHFAGNNPVNIVDPSGFQGQRFRLQQPSLLGGSSPSFGSGRFGFDLPALQLDPSLTPAPPATPGPAPGATTPAAAAGGDRPGITSLEPQPAPEPAQADEPTAEEDPGWSFDADFSLFMPRLTLDLRRGDTSVGNLTAEATSARLRIGPERELNFQAAYSYGGDLELSLGNRTGRGRVTIDPGEGEVGLQVETRLPDASQLTFSTSSAGQIQASFRREDLRIRAGGNPLQRRFQLSLTYGELPIPSAEEFGRITPGVESATGLAGEIIREGAFLPPDAIPIITERSEDIERIGEAADVLMRVGRIRPPVWGAGLTFSGRPVDVEIPGTTETVERYDLRLQLQLQAVW